jgi:hypothetical protein
MVMRSLWVLGGSESTPAGVPGGEGGGERGFGGGAGTGAGRGPGRLAVVDDVLGGEDPLAGSQQGGAGSAVVFGNPALGSGDIGHPRGPVAGQDRAVRGTPRCQAGSDEGLGCGDVLGTDQHRRGLAEQAGPVVHRVDDVAVGPAGAPVGLAEVPDEFSAAPAENRELAAEPVGGNEHGKLAGGHGGRPLRPALGV